MFPGITSRIVKSFVQGSKISPSLGRWCSNIFRSDNRWSVPDIHEIWAIRGSVTVIPRPHSTEHKWTSPSPRRITLAVSLPGKIRYVEPWVLMLTRLLSKSESHRGADPVDVVCIPPWWRGFCGLRRRRCRLRFWGSLRPCIFGHDEQTQKRKKEKSFLQGDETWSSL